MDRGHCKASQRNDVGRGVQLTLKERRALYLYLPKTGKTCKMPQDNPNMYITMNPSTSGPNPPIRVLLMVFDNEFFCSPSISLKVVVCRGADPSEIE